MQDHTQAGRDRRPGIRTTIGCGAAVAILAVTAFSAQAAQASIVTVGSGSSVSGVVSTVTTAAPVLTPVISTGSTGSTGSGSGSGSGSLVTVGTGASGSGVTVGVGSGLVTVGVGAGTGTDPSTPPSGTPTSTPTPTPTPTSTPAPSSAPSTGSPTSKPPVRVLSTRVTRSNATIYPSKDGYRDSVRFDISGITSTGTVGAVTGTAKLMKGSKLIKTWKLTRSTQAVVWNGMVGKHLRAGLYTLRVVLHSGGKTFTTSTTVTVSAKKLVTRTVRISTRLDGSIVKNRMPNAVRRAYAKGPVFLQITTIVDRISGSARLGFVNGRMTTYTPLVIGAHTSPKLPVPNTAAFRTVTFKHDWKPGSVKLRAIRLVWTYKALQ